MRRPPRPREWNQSLLNTHDCSLLAGRVDTASATWLSITRLSSPAQLDWVFPISTQQPRCPTETVEDFRSYLQDLSAKNNGNLASTCYVEMELLGSGELSITSKWESWASNRLPQQMGENTSRASVWLTTRLLKLSHPHSRAVSEHSR